MSIERGNWTELKPRRRWLPWGRWRVQAIFRANRLKERIDQDAKRRLRYRAAILKLRDGRALG